MKFSKEIKGSMNVFFYIYVGITLVMLLIKPLPFALHMLKSTFSIAALLSAILFAKRNHRFFVREEYVQLIIFGTLLNMALTGYLFYKTYGMAFIKDTVELLIVGDMAVWISIAVVIFLPALLLSLFYSNFMMKFFLNEKERGALRGALPKEKKSHKKIYASLILAVATIAGGYLYLQENRKTPKLFVELFLTLTTADLDDAGTTDKLFVTINNHEKYILNKEESIDRNTTHLYRLPIKSSINTIFALSVSKEGHDTWKPKELKFHFKLKDVNRYSAQYIVTFNLKKGEPDNSIELSKIYRFKLTKKAYQHKTLPTIRIQM